MRSNTGIASTVFKTLSEKGINIQMISTSEIRISIIVAKKQGKEAVKVLHKVFKLGT